MLKGPHNQTPTGLERAGASGIGVESAAPARSGSPRLVQREVGVESALSHWSQLLELESAWSQVFWVGVSCFRWSQRGVSGSGVESAWSQVFWVGVSVESGVSGWSQRGAGAESAACGPWAVGPSLGGA